MKSFFLTGLRSESIARDALRKLLPGQEAPWLLHSASGDTVAYFNVLSLPHEAQGVQIQVDVSGRHYSSDEAVLQVLSDLQGLLGGVVENDV